MFYSLDSFSDVFQNFIRLFTKYANYEIQEELGFGMDFYEFWYQHDTHVSNLEEHFFQKLSWFYSIFCFSKEKHISSKTA